jgi:mitotic spindle assembly checkpoint protein MAD1
LEQKLFDLSGDIAAGHHVPPGVRILSMKQNPTQEWVDLRQAAMNRLRAENDALLERLKELEASASSSTRQGVGTELVPRESWDLVSKEKKELESLLEQKEKRIMRLKEVRRHSVS